MFEFLKYVQPGNYYSLASKMPQAVILSNENFNQRIGYRLDISEKLDRAYYNLQSGIIPSNANTRQIVQDDNVLDVFDNYIFLRRYFSRMHVLMVFILRLLSLKNPIYEIYCFLKTIGHTRLEIKQKLYQDFQTFQSELIKSKPLVSVIIPTLNRYNYLKNVFKDLEKQDYKNFEVIVCDQSDPIDMNFYDGWSLNIQLVRQEEKALWQARNQSIKVAKGQYIALSEDDVIIPFDWITNHLKCLDFFQIDISAGVFYRENVILEEDIKGQPTFKMSHQFPTGNSFLSKSVFERIGLFDRQFEKQRMGDGEFGLRALLSGFKIVANPMAFIIDIKAPTGGLREMGSWDAFRPTKIFAPRPIPSVLYFIRRYFGSAVAWYFLVKNIPQSYIPYGKKGNKILLLIIYTMTPLWFPFAFFAVWKSWILSSQKLREGPRIEELIS